MSYKALLFCPDEKTARTVTQVLSELEFEVQPCNEPFAAVKKLTTEHFDALVVDCENEQNAVLLFKSARNSVSNQASLSIAVVEGQAGVAKAFRIGANLVLTKPINVEQSKGTIRVARGLLRKSESAKAAAPSAVQPEQPSVAGMPSVSAPGPSSVFELEAEPEARPEPTEAAFLESMPDPAASMSRGTMADASTGNPISQPMATALRDAAEAAGHREASVPFESTMPLSLGSGIGAAPAPAKQKPPIAEEETHQIEPPIFATSIGQRSFSSSDGAGSRKALLIAAVILIIAAAGYIGWKKTHLHFSLNLLHKSPAPAQTLRQPSPPPAPVVPAPAVPNPEPSAITTPTLPPEPSPEVSPAPPAPVQESTSAKKEMPAPKLKKAASPIASSDGEAPPVRSKASVETSTPAIVVRKGEQKAAEPPPASEIAPEPSAPGALDVAGDSKNEAIAGLVNVSPSVPRTAPETLKVSQGVSQGLIVKKVAPVYPQQAIQMKIQGAVQLIATISKDGDITNVKLLSGDDLLGRAAIDAVKQWKYKPYLLDSQPVDIQTQITVNFRLP